MGVVLSLALRRSARRTVLLGIALGAFLFLVGLSYSSVDENQIRSLVESLPPAIQAFVKGSDIASPAGYLGSTFIHPITLSIMAATAIAAGAAPARDVETGVAELMLSRPLTRTAWLGAEMIAMVIQLVVVALLGFAGALIAVTTVDALAPIAVGNRVLTAIPLLLLFIGIGAVTMLAGAFSRTGTRAIGWGTAFALVAYALDYLAQVWGVAEPLGPLSVMHWYRPATILGGGTVPGSTWAVLVGVAVVAGAAALAVTSRREVAP
jgi:ABC-2 type transport system permease protein